MDSNERKQLIKSCTEIKNLSYYVYIFFSVHPQVN